MQENKVSHYMCVNFDIVYMFIFIDHVIWRHDICVFVFVCVCLF